MAGRAGNNPGVAVDVRLRVERDWLPRPVIVPVFGARGKSGCFKQSAGQSRARRLERLLSPLVIGLMTDPVLMMMDRIGLHPLNGICRAGDVPANSCRLDARGGADNWFGRRVDAARR